MVAYTRDLRRASTCPRKLGRLVILRSNPRTRSEDRSRARCSFEAAAGGARERHEARMVVSGGTEHALTVLRTGRCGGGSLGSPGLRQRRGPFSPGRRQCASSWTHRGKGVLRVPRLGTRAFSPSKVFVKIASLRRRRSPPVRKSVSSVW